MPKEILQTPAEFAKEKWSLLFSGAFASAAILLLIGYYKYKRGKENPIDQGEEAELEALATEASSNIEDVSMLLEIGSAVADVIPEVEEISEELAQGLKGRAQEIMRTIGCLGRKK